VSFHRGLAMVLVLAMMEEGGVISPIAPIRESRFRGLRLKIGNALFARALKCLIGVCDDS
jgi:hypothetical protein